MLDNGCKRCRHDDAGKHGLIEIADQLFKRKGDGGDRSIEGCSDAGSHADRGHAPAILRAEASGARHQAADASADLDSRAL